MKDKKKRFFSFKKNKKGFLLGEETLKIIIAVIGIIFLVFLLVSVYLSVAGNQDLRSAEADKEKISQEITRINNGEETNPQGLLVPNPTGWHIFSFIGEDKKPNLCAGANCLCICEKLLIGIINTNPRQIQRCDDKGACLVVQNLKRFDEIKIGNRGTSISIQKINNEIQIAKK